MIRGLFMSSNVKLSAIFITLPFILVGIFLLAYIKYAGNNLANIQIQISLNTIITAVSIYLSLVIFSVYAKFIKYKNTEIFKKYERRGYLDILITSFAVSILVLFFIVILTVISAYISSNILTCISVYLLLSVITLMFNMAIPIVRLVDIAKSQSV